MMMTTPRTDDGMVWTLDGVVRMKVKMGMKGKQGGIRGFSPRIMMAKPLMDFSRLVR